ncbi:MAG TPA: hypothetical protein VI138_01745 [Candidatus Dormibacteraeota bacterium]
MRTGRARAKLNLALELTGRRPDGYHELAAVSQTIDWSDVVALETGRPGERRQAAPALEVSGPESHRVPPGASNLAAQAARLLDQDEDAAPIRRIFLEKRVPPQSGLGGGSADAAAVLRLAGGALAPARLAEIALLCGADVPFSLHGGAAHLSGIGEVVVPLPPVSSGVFLVAILGSVSTAAAYAATLAADFSDGGRADRMAGVLRASQPPPSELLGSGLEPAALRAVPALEPRLERLRRATVGTTWAMTGSGGAFFTYASDGRTAADLAQVVASAFPPGDLQGIRIALPVGPRAD